MMVTRKTIQMTGALAAALTCALAASAVMVAPSDAVPAGTGELAARHVPEVSARDERLSLADFEPFLGNLRRAPPPLPPPVIVPPPPVAPAVDAQLLGTVIGPGDKYAIFQAASSIEFKRRGDVIAGRAVGAISDGAVELVQDGRAITLRVPPPQE